MTSQDTPLKPSVTGLARRMIGARVLQPLTHRLFRALKGARGNVDPANRVHPFDLRHGVDTSGSLPAALLGVGSAADRHVTCYLGCVPSVVSTALATIPDRGRATFIDIGCGKGRALLIARALGFARLRGIELNPVLAAKARANAAMVAAKSPGGDIEIIEGDASAPQLPDGDCVVFIYHPFGRPLVERLVDSLTAQAGDSRRLFVVMENPVHGDLMDAQPAFARWYAATLPYAPEEIGFGADADEPIAIWATAPAGRTPHRADGKITVRVAGWRAEVG